jgi:hypothetical protein
MTKDNLAGQLLEEEDMEQDIQQQRKSVMESIQKHELRHKWITRTFSTLFWATAAGAWALAVIVHNESLLTATIFWLLLGAIVIIQSRLRSIELKIEEVRVMLDGVRKGSK